MTPALAHSTTLGPYDFLSQFGLAHRNGVVVHNLQTGDQITMMIPWTTLAWTQVHHGQLPLWNPYSALGMPLAFNWQSQPFSLPSLLGYLVPVHLAFTVQVLAILVIAGTGVYVLCRLLRLGVLAAVLAATVFELSGPFMGLLGWPVASVMSWAGWLFAAALLVVRGRHRARHVTAFAVVLALAVYAGQPEVMVVLGLALLVFVAVVLVFRVGTLGEPGPILRPAVDLAIATVAGGALAAPLALPGLQVGNASFRITKASAHAVPLHNLLHLIFQNFDGLPVAGSQWFGYGFYLDTLAYLGVIAVVLAVTAVAVVPRRPEVVAFGVVAFTMALLVFSPLVLFMNALPKIGGVLWFRALVPMAFAVAVLAGVGIDALVRSPVKRGIRYWAGGGFVVAGLVLVAIWAFGRGHLPPVQASIRAKSFIWPAVETALGLAVVGALALVHRRHDGKDAPNGGVRIGAGRWAAASLLACETAFLVAAGAPLFSSSSSFLAPTPAEVALERAVGSSIVGLGTPSCEHRARLGIPLNVNIDYGVQEFAVHDPVIPKAYFRSWQSATRNVGGDPKRALFCPGVTSTTLARRYGVGFVLELPGAPGPRGGVFYKKVGEEDLYWIPGAAAATLTPVLTRGELPPVDAPGTPVAVTHPDPASWRLVTDSNGPQVLRLRLTDVPGWHGTVDGHPLALRPFAGVMLQAHLPAGRHTVELNYWPAAFTAGIVLAALSAAGLLIVTLVATMRRRSTRPGT
jgi:hypothetical protein